MNDNFIKRFASDSQDGKTELVNDRKQQEEELMNRYLYSSERNVEGMSWDEYQDLYSPFREAVDNKLDEEGWIYESPDGGKTVTRRRLGSLDKEVIKPKHPYDRDWSVDEDEKEYGVEAERDRIDVWLSKQFKKEREERMDDQYRQETFGPLDEEERTLAEMLDQALNENYGVPMDPDAEQAKDEVQMAVDPGHYKGVACGKQYMELMVEMLDGYSGVEAHLLGQSYKYMMRLGKKDLPEQDAKKAAWYLIALVQYYKNGDIDANKVSELVGKI